MAIQQCTVYAICVRLCSFIVTIIVFVWMHYIRIVRTKRPEKKNGVITVMQDRTVYYLRFVFQFFSSVGSFKYLVGVYFLRFVKQLSSAFGGLFVFVSLLLLLAPIHVDPFGIVFAPQCCTVCASFMYLTTAE